MTSEILKPEEMSIVFRKVKTVNIVTIWYVEAYSPGNEVTPVGIACIAQVKETALLSFIFVAEHWRCEGYGKAMIQAIKGRWPHLQLSSPIDKDFALKFAVVPQSPAIRDLDCEGAGESHKCDQR